MLTRNPWVWKTDPFRKILNRRCGGRKDSVAAAAAAADVVVADVVAVVGMPSGRSRIRKPGADIRSADGSCRFRSRSEPPANSKYKK